MSTVTRRQFMEAGAWLSAAAAVGPSLLRQGSNEPILPADMPIPDHGGRVIYVARHSSGRAAGNGSRNNPFRTIQQAAEVAKPGDTVVVREGVYRERVLPARGGTEDAPITYMAAPGEAVHIKGSELLRADWEQVDDGIYRAALPAALFKRTAIRDLEWVDWNPFSEYQGGYASGLSEKLTLGQVSVNGVLLSQAPDQTVLERTPGSWRAVEGGTAILVHFAEGEPPERARADGPEGEGTGQTRPQWVSAVGGVEVTVRDRVFAPHLRGLGHIHVRGFVMEHCANRFPGAWFYVDPVDGWGGSQQAGMLGTRTGHHWVIEHNVIQNANSLGIDCGHEFIAGPAPVEGGNYDNTDGKWDMEGQGREGNPDHFEDEWIGYHLIRDNVISHNGSAGIMGGSSTETQILYNVIEDNNWGGHEESHHEDGAIKLHFYYRGVIEGNLIRGNDTWGVWLDNFWRDSRITRNVIVDNKIGGIFMELDFGPALIDNNIIAFNRGYGVYGTHCERVTVAHNYIHSNDRQGILFRYDGREVGVPAWIEPDYWDQFPNLPTTRHREHRFVNNLVTNNRGTAMEVPSGSDRSIVTARNTTSGLGRVEWGRIGPIVDFHAPQNLRNQVVPAADREDGVDVDFYNTPLPEGDVLRGPFQMVQTGFDRHVLWPVSARAFVPAFAPGNVRAELLDSGDVEVTWDAARFAGSYKVYRAAGREGEFELVAEDLNDTSFTDSDIGDADIYAYAIATVNVEGRESARSSRATVYTNPITQYETFANTEAKFYNVDGALLVAANGIDAHVEYDEYGTAFIPAALGPNGQVTAKLLTQERASGWSKAGVVVRNDLTKPGEGRGYAIAAVTPDHGLQWQVDSDDDGYLDTWSGMSGLAPTRYPVWFRIVRNDNQFTAFYSDDGESWTEMGQATLESVDEMQDAGLFVSATTPDRVSAVEFTDFSVTNPE